MSFETVALFPGSCLIKSKTSFLEIVSKEKVSLPKFSFIFLQLSSFSKFIFPVDSRRFKSLVIFGKYSLKVLKFMKTQDTFWYTRYKNLRDDLKSNIDRNKKNYLREYFQKHAKNSKETWNKINQIFLLSLRVSFFSVKIMLSVALHLAVKKDLTVSRIFCYQLFHLCLESQRMSF